ncbi:MAG: elongation factor G, partial [Myxococcales bacterium]|nr:elongation factor G [Myxococcales bacterium]
VGVDAASGLPLISGTGALQLALYAERLGDEHDLAVELGSPRVTYREAITAEVHFEHLHRKQSGGGSGQYAGVSGIVRPIDEPEIRFVDGVRGGAIPRPFIDACDRGFRDALGAGPLVGGPVVGVEVELLDGKTHPVDSSDLAFHIAARDAMREALSRARPVILEPIMRVEVDAPEACFGAVGSNLVRHRGSIVDSRTVDARALIVARVPLAELFDFATELDSLTGGRGTHSMSLDGHAPVPAGVPVDA